MARFIGDITGDPRVDDVVVYRPEHIRKVGQDNGDMENRTGRICELRGKIVVVQWYDIWPNKSAVLTTDIMEIHNLGRATPAEDFTASPEPSRFHAQRRLALCRGVGWCALLVATALVLAAASIVIKWAT